jgi:putative ABC transport system substrate-binding protein
MNRRELITLVRGAAVWPFAAQAQQTGSVRRIAYLALAPAENTGLMKVIVDRLSELGWFEGQNLAIEYRSAEGDAKRLTNLPHNWSRQSRTCSWVALGRLHLKR